MTFDDDARIGRSRVSKRGRGRGVAIGGGGGLVAIVAVFLIAQFTGVDLSGLLGASGGGGVTGARGEEISLEQCQTGADANENVDCRMVGAADSLNAFWATEVDGYEDPALVLFTANVDTGCGAATSAVGPFYCPADRQVYIDTAFYDELSSRFGASGGPLAELYVVAHEWGHHIQHLTGRMDDISRESGPTSDGVRLELQADCYAGAWARSASTVPDEQGTPYLEPITDQQIADALSAASAVGDDSIQERTSGQVQPETWTHGSSEQRQRWFLTGFENGAGACDTFSVVGADL